MRMGRGNGNGRETKEKSNAGEIEPGPEASDAILRRSATSARVHATPIQGGVGPAIPSRGLGREGHGGAVKIFFSITLQPVSERILRISLRYEPL